MTSQHQRSLDLFKDLALAWNDAGIRWALLGRHAPDHRFDDDIDVVIDPEMFGKARRLLEQVVEQRGAQIVQVFRHEHQAFAAVIAQGHAQELGFVSIDMSPEFRYDGKVLQTGAELLQERKLSDNSWLWLPNDDAAFAHYLLKSAAKNRFNDEGRAYFNSLTVDPFEATKTALDSKAAAQIQAWLSSEAELDRDQMRRSYSHRYPATWSSRWVELKRFWLRARQPTGLYVAITGPDGVGKSTVSQKVFGLTKPCFRAVETSHLSVRTTAMKTTPPVQAPYTKKARGGLGSLLKLVVLVLRFHRLYWRWVWPHLRKHGLFWSDRHFGDFVADPERFRVRLPLSVRRLSWNLLPHPDLTFVLVAKPETIQSRCSEVSLDQTQSQLARYEAMVTYSKSLVRVPADQTADQVAYAVTAVIISRLADRQRARGWI